MTDSNVGTETVRDANLRTYASAEWAIYGDSEDLLQEVKRDAEANPEKVARYTPQAFDLLFFERDEDAKDLHAVSVVQPPRKPGRGRRRRSLGSSPTTRE
jgi:hypothetical protein